MFKTLKENENGKSIIFNKLLNAANKYAEEYDYYDYLNGYEDEEKSAEWASTEDDEKIRLYFNYTDDIEVIVEEAELEGVEIYYSDDLRKDMLQLSDYHVLFDINVNIDQDTYGEEVTRALENFDEENNVETQTLGRSGRHICIDPTLDNLLNYDRIKSNYEVAERNFINYINSNYEDRNSEGTIGESLEVKPLIESKDNGDIINMIKNKFEEIKSEKGISNDELLDNGTVYYMNGNDGTDFDWQANDRTCEFEVFYKETELGMAKLSVYKDGSIEGYFWGDKGHAQGEAINAGKIDRDDAKFLVAGLYLASDAKNIYDKELDSLDIPEEIESSDYNRMAQWIENYEDDEEWEDYDPYEEDENNDDEEYYDESLQVREWYDPKKCSNCKAEVPEGKGYKINGETYCDECGPNKEDELLSQQEDLEESLIVKEDKKEDWNKFCKSMKRKGFLDIENMTALSDNDFIDKLSFDELEMFNRLEDYGYDEIQDMVRKELNESLIVKENKKEVPYDNTTVKKCPRCGQEYTAYPALSRKDNETYICPDCGVEEAMEDYYASLDRENFKDESLNNKFNLTLEAFGLKLTDMRVEGDILKVKINGKEYGYKNDTLSAQELKDKFDSIAKHSEGKAFAWLKAHSQLVSGGKGMQESLKTEGTKQKRIARNNEFDNGNVFHSWKEMSDEEAEEQAKQASMKDPNDVYYVAYDDIMNPCSEIRWFRGKQYTIDSINDENSEYKKMKDQNYQKYLDNEKRLKESKEIKLENNEGNQVEVYHFNHKLNEVAEMLDRAFDNGNKPLMEKYMEMISTAIDKYKEFNK